MVIKQAWNIRNYGYVGDVSCCDAKDSKKDTFIVSYSWSPEDIQPSPSME
jgi:hypothetical protein